MWSFWASRATLPNPTCSASASSLLSSSLLQTREHALLAEDGRSAFSEKHTASSPALNFWSVTQRREMLALEEANLQLSYADHLLQDLQPQSAAAALRQPLPNSAQESATAQNSESRQPSSPSHDDLDVSTFHKASAEAVAAQRPARSTPAQTLVQAARPRHHPLAMHLESTLESIGATLLEWSPTVEWRHNQNSSKFVQQERPLIQAMPDKVQRAGLAILVLLLALAACMLYTGQSGVCKATMASEPDGQGQPTDEVWRFNENKDPFMVGSVESFRS